MVSFDLLEQAWLPLQDIDGKRQLWGLQQTLAQAHRVRGLTCDEPLEKTALLRLMLAVLHRVFGPDSTREWTKIWRQGALDANALECYFQKWQDAFDLFHPDRPFYQLPPEAWPAPPASPNPVQVLMQIVGTAAGNNSTLFDHSQDEDPGCVTFEKTARLVVLNQAFALGLGKSRTGDRTDSPAIRAASFLWEGKTLFETLVLNLPAQAGRPVGRPTWERDLPTYKTEGIGRPPEGVCDLLTWQSRALWLVPPAPGEEVIRHLWLAQGEKLEDCPQPNNHGIYRAHKEHGWVSKGFQSAKALWRDSAAILESAYEGQDAVAPTLQWVHEFNVQQVLAGRRALPLIATGLATAPGKATKVVLRREERFQLPLVYLKNPGLVETLHRELDSGESVGQALRKRLSGMLKELGAGGKESKLLEHLWTAAGYWEGLELPFKNFLADLPVEEASAVKNWRGCVRVAALAGFDRAAGQLHQDARTLRATVQAKSQLYGALRKQGLLEETHV